MEYHKAIWHTLRPVGIFKGHFPQYWYVVPRKMWQPCVNKLSSQKEGKNGDASITVGPSFIVVWRMGEMRTRHAWTSPSLLHRGGSGCFLLNKTANPSPKGPYIGQSQPKGPENCSTRFM
jgi:hypothetical protein